MLHALLVLSELRDQPPLLRRQVPRNVHVERDDLVAHEVRPHGTQPLVPQPHLRIALRARRHVHVHRTTQRGHRDRSAQHGRRHRDRHRAVHVRPAPTEVAVRLHLHRDVQVPRPPATHARVALTHQADGVAVVDARWDLHGDGRRRVLHAAAVTGGTWLRVDGAAATAAGTGPHGHHHAAVGLHMRGERDAYVDHAFALALRTRLMLVVRTLRERR